MADSKKNRKKMYHLLQYFKKEWKNKHYMKMIKKKI